MAPKTMALISISSLTIRSVSVQFVSLCDNGSQMQKYHIQLFETNQAGSMNIYHTPVHHISHLTANTDFLLLKLR